ncbi:hypothetical protein SCP_0801650 [Sparassis crispa]|uniref:Uncharacterized protein n=1 Tax=Sparassis crispa TaxID=139825 RepID=A0A401GTU1_9APHY|nr:hypothetical protein SCP_0801650 [Sparassis crispa]GBE85645.1 hypothetical protein SCP_0801650 [Sparassis crispa]
MRVLTGSVFATAFRSTSTADGLHHLHSRQCDDHADLPLERQYRAWPTTKHAPPLRTQFSPPSGSGFAITRGLTTTRTSRHANTNPVLSFLQNTPNTAPRPTQMRVPTARAIWRAFAAPLHSTSTADTLHHLHSRQCDHHADLPLERQYRAWPTTKHVAPLRAPPPRLSPSHFATARGLTNTRTSRRANPNAAPSPSHNTRTRSVRIFLCYFAYILLTSSNANTVPRPTKTRACTARAIPHAFAPLSTAPRLPTPSTTYSRQPDHHADLPFEHQYRAWATAKHAPPPRVPQPRPSPSHFATAPRSTTARTSRSNAKAAPRPSQSTHLRCVRNFLHTLGPVLAPCPDSECRRTCPNSRTANNSHLARFPLATATMASVTDAPATTTGSKCKMRHLSPSAPVPSPAKRQKPEDSDDIFSPTAHTDSTASDTPADDAHASHRPDETPGKPYRNKGKRVEKTRTPTEVLQSLSKLRETLAVTRAMNNVFVLVQPVYLKRAFPSNIAERLDHVSITTAHNIINLATADPTALHFVTIGASDYLQLKTSTHLTLFSVVGSVTHSDLISPSGRSRQLCVAPSALTWPRAAAVLGAILNRRTLVFPSFHAGLSFSTRLTTGTSNTPTKIRGMAPATPVNAQRGPPPVLPADRDVPTFDGCKPFKFSMHSISMLPKIHDDLSTESAVLLLFTLGKYIKSHPELDDENADTTISLNIQSIVLLANPGLMPRGFLEDEPMPLLGVFRPNSEPDQHHSDDSDDDDASLV